MKHVSLCEYNPEETIKTNLNGTKKLIKASIKKVNKFILLALINLLSILYNGEK